MAKKFALLAVFFAVGFAQAAESEIEVKKDIPYRTDKDADKERNILDVHSPKGKNDLPVIFFVHGGSWTFGNKGTFIGPAKSYCEAGFVVVAINYRLSPKSKHPAHIEDVAKAFAWTVDHIGEYGGDPKKIVAMGHSAGGHLVALLGTDESYLKSEKKSFKDIRGVVGVSGVYRIDSRVKQFHSIFGDDESGCKAASPLEHVGDKHPAKLLVYADKDFAGLGKQAEDLSKALGKNKCEATAKEYADRTHLTILSKQSSPDDPVFKDVKEFVVERTK